MAVTLSEHLLNLRRLSQKSTNKGSMVSWGTIVVNGCCGKWNPPSASNMEGVWEEQISARTILSSLLKTHGTSLNDESLCTLLIEVEAIVNSHPLTTDLLSDGNSMILLSLIHLLTLKSRVLQQTFIVVNIGEVCSISPMSSGVDWEKKFLQHFIVDKNGMPLDENAKWVILPYSRKQQQNEIVGQWQK